MQNKYNITKLIRSLSIVTSLFLLTTATSQVLINGSVGNGDFENISPSDAPIQSDIRRAANTTATFTIPQWTVTQIAGYVGIDAARSASSGKSYAFVNQSSEAIFLSDVIKDVDIKMGQGLKLSINATNYIDGKTAYYDVTFILDGVELKLARHSITVPQANVFHQVEFDEQILFDVKDVAVKITLVNRGDGAIGGQPRFDDVKLEVVSDTVYPDILDKCFVATDGDDNNDGSFENPFRTIQKAADVVKYGGLIEIREGTYREKVTIARGGLTDKPLVFKPYNDERVVVTTCELVSGWESVTGDINQDGTDDADVWQVTMNWDAGGNSANNTMFVDDTLRYVAREKAETNPIYLDDWGIIPHRALKHEGFTAPELAGWGDDFWNGAKIYHHTSDWSGQVSVIGDYRSSDGKVTFQDKLTYFPSQKQRFGYYIFGTIKALNRPHEWYKVPDTDTLYYMAEPGTDPNDLDIEMKKRDFTFDLQGANNVVIKNLIHRGGGPTSATPCKNFTLQGNDIYGFSENGYGYLKIYGDNVIIRDNTFRKSFKAVMGVSGDRWDIVNNKFEDISYKISDTGISIGSTSSRFLISHNTFSGLGRGIICFYPLKSIISYNVFEKYCRNSWDTAALDGDFSQGQGGGTLIHHNIFRDSPQYNAYKRGAGSDGSGSAAMYSGLELTVYRNIFFDAGRWPTVNTKFTFHNFYHNTFAGAAPKMYQGGVIESSYLNNLQVSKDLIVAPNLMETGNINITSADFTDLANEDVRLSSASRAIDCGTLISGINDDYKGSGPDAGALEYGDTLWQCGHDFINSPTVSYDYSPPIGSNIMGDGGFTNTQGWEFVEKSSVYNTNRWNHGALGWYGSYSFKLLNSGVVERSFDEIQPNKSYELAIEARLVYPAIKADKYSQLNGTASVANHRGENYITEVDEGESLAYDNIDFGDGSLYDHVEVSFACTTPLTPDQARQNSLELRIGSPSGTLISTAKYRSGVGDSWVWTNAKMLTAPTGEQTVYLVPKGSESGNIRITSARFYKEQIDVNNRLIVGIEGHGYAKEFNYVGRGHWINKYEKMQFTTGDSVGEFKVFFKNPSQYEAYVSRAYLKEIEPFDNIATLGESFQSSTLGGSVAQYGNDGLRDNNAATTDGDSVSFWQVELANAQAIRALRISSASDGPVLKNISVSLTNSDPRLGGRPLLSREYAFPDATFSNGQSLYLSIHEWIKEELDQDQISSINFVKVERLDGELLSLSEVEVIPFNDDVNVFSQESKGVDKWEYTFSYDINPTQLTVINGDENVLESMKIVVRNGAGNTLWEKVYKEGEFNLLENARYKIAGNEVSDDGETRLASVLARSIVVEKVGSDLNLNEFKIFDGTQMAPQGNIAIQGKATQIGEFYRSGGYADLANNGYIFPSTDYITTANTANPWWELELAEVADIDQIVLWNRSDIVENRIGNFTVSVMDGSRTLIWSKDYAYSRGDLANGKSLTINTDHKNARYIRVQCKSSYTFLHLAEVQVWTKSAESVIRTLPLQNVYKFDLGPLTQEVESGWMGVNPLTTGDVWWSLRPEAIDREIPGATYTNRDFAFSNSANTLNVRLPNGTWNVNVTMGDAAIPREGLHLIAEDLVMAQNISTEAGEFTTYSQQITVDDGILNISVSNTSEDDLIWLLNSLTIDNGETFIHSTSKEETDIKVYPNPARNTLYVDFNNVDTKLIGLCNSVDLINPFGQVVKQFDIESNSNVYSISDVSSGYYVLRVRKRNRIFVFPLIIGGV